MTFPSSVESRLRSSGASEVLRRHMLVYVDDATGKLMALRMCETESALATPVRALVVRPGRLPATDIHVLKPLGPASGQPAPRR